LRVKVDEIEETSKEETKPISRVSKLTLN